MTTILTLGDADGDRRCDARCHNARGPECDCACRGRYHGIGENAAAAMIAEDVENGIYGPEVRTIADQARLDFGSEEKP